MIEEHIKIDKNLVDKFTIVFIIVNALITTYGKWFYFKYNNKKKNSNFTIKLLHRNVGRNQLPHNV